MPLPMSSRVMVRVRPCVVSFLHRALSFGNERCGSAAPTRLLLALASLLLLLVLGPHASQCRLLANFIHSCCASRLCRSSNAAQLRLGQNFSVLSLVLSHSSVSAQSQSALSRSLSSVCVSVQSVCQFSLSRSHSRSLSSVSVSVLFPALFSGLFSVLFTVLVQSLPQFSSQFSVTIQS